MGKIVFLIILTILQFIKFTFSDGLVVPVEVEPQKRKNININMEVNLGIGGNCTAADILLGNCTNYPNGTTLKPMFLTPLKPRATEKRKFEKIGEYIKMKLCSYGFDDGRSCHVFCTMLGYARHACSDLTLCHCWSKPDQPTQNVESPTKKAAQETIAIRAQTAGPRQGVLVWVRHCRESDDCRRYCTLKNYNGHECTDDETCHCFGLKPPRPVGPVKCTVLDALDWDCLDHCHAKDFDSSRCLKDGTCQCYSEEDEIQDAKENEEQYITLRNCADGTLNRCGAVCGLLKFEKFECSNKDKCHCFNNSVPAKKPRNLSLDHLMTGEYIKLDCTSKRNGGNCKKRCAQKGYQVFECVREDTCRCYDGPDDGDIGKGQRIIYGHRMLVADSNSSGNFLKANSTVMKDDKNMNNSPDVQRSHSTNVLGKRKRGVPHKLTHYHDGGTRRIINSSGTASTHWTRSTKTTVATTKVTAPSSANFMTAKRISVASVARKSTFGSNIWRKIHELTVKA